MMEIKKESYKKISHRVATGEKNIRNPRSRPIESPLFFHNVSMTTTRASAVARTNPTVSPRAAAGYGTREFTHTPHQPAKVPPSSSLSLIRASSMQLRHE